MTDQLNQQTTWNGLPPDPSKDGWHWLRFIGHTTLEPWYWRASDEVWDTDDDGTAVSMGAFLVYVAPCPYPKSNTDGESKSAVSMPRLQQCNRLCRFWLARMLLGLRRKGIFSLAFY